MKKLLRTCVLIVGLLTPTLAAKAADTYTLDPDHTAVTWTISHLGFSHPWGKFTMITGTLILDQQNPRNSSVTANITTSNIATGIGKLDENLKSKEFFDVDTYPEAVFTSDKVTLTGKNTATVEGTLTLHGASRQETLYVTLNKIGDNMLKKKTTGFSATATIKRSDFGMTSYLPMIGDEVKLYIESEANL